MTVALIGPDGAGKTTIARRLESAAELRIKYLYMGVSAASSNRLLPTTRVLYALKRALGAPPDTAGPPDSSHTAPAPRNPLRRALKAARAAFGLLNRVG